ncbi:hypothetical protein ACHAWC_002932 [Mediolabrus comicus]
MKYMFYGVPEFNSDISGWDVSNVEDFQEMFYEAYAFNQDLSQWNISPDSNVMGMFTLASSFNQNLCAWKDKFPYGFDTSEAIFDDTACTYTDRPRKRNEFGGPFYRDELKIAIDTCFEGDDPATAATIEEYNPAKCDGLVKVKYGWPMNTWCTGEVDNMELLFVGKRDFNEDISEWDTSKVTNLYETFSYAESFTGDISKWDVSNVWKMFGLFNGEFVQHLPLKS